MNALNTITVLPETKEEIESYLKQVKSEILAGNENPLKIKKQLKVFSDVIKKLESDQEIRDYVICEAEKYGQKTFEDLGAKFQIREAKKYDYSECNDPELKRLKSEESKIKEQVKARENWLKKLEEVTPDSETGEFINPPSHITNTSLAITLK